MTRSYPNHAPGPERQHLEPCDLRPQRCFCTAWLSRDAPPGAVWVRSDTLEHLEPLHAAAQCADKGCDTTQCLIVFRWIEVDPKSVIVANQGCNLASFCPWRGEWPITPSQGLYCPAIKQGCLRHPPTRIHTKHLSISSFSSFNYSFSSLLQDKEPVE